MTEAPVSEVLEKAAARKVKPYRDTTRFGIMNPFGQIWSSTTFRTEGEALTYVHDWCVSNGINPAGFKAIPVKVTVSLRQAASQAKR